MPEGASLSSLVLGPYDISRGDTADRDLLDQNFLFHWAHNAFIHRGPAMLFPPSCRSQCCLLLIILPSALIGSMGVCRALNVFGFLHTREKWHFLPPIIRHDGVYLSFLWWSAFSKGFFFLAQKLRRPELGHFRNDVEEIRLPVSAPDFFPFHLAFRWIMEERNSNFHSDSLTNLITYAPTH